LLREHGLDHEARTALQIRAEALAQRLRLPLRATKGGQTGQWLGAGIGASLEFQDHRQYQPGDDPRHLNWAAFARTGQYTMKMFREEVSPRLDVVLDCSPSMFLTRAKAARTLELFAFTIACAARAGALVRAYQANSDVTRELPIDSLRAHTWEPLPKTNRLGAPTLGRVPWRQQSLRIIITDLLYPVPPEGVLGPLLHTPGRAILFCPWSRLEAEPDWDGQVDLVECESDEHRLFQVTPGRLERYRGNYRRHFALWDEACRAKHVAFARVADEGALQDRLMESAVPNGAVELAQA
jgi:uncharacterized protein (DUF58 family)